MNWGTDGLLVTRRGARGHSPRSALEAIPPNRAPAQRTGRNGVESRMRPNADAVDVWSRGAVRCDQTALEWLAAAWVSQLRADYAQLKHSTAPESTAPRTGNRGA